LKSWERGLEARLKWWNTKQASMRPEFKLQYHKKSNNENLKRTLTDTLPRRK
jgi:hypothetical protein